MDLVSFLTSRAARRVGAIVPALPLADTTVSSAKNSLLAELRRLRTSATTLDNQRLKAVAAAQQYLLTAEAISDTALDAAYVASLNRAKSTARTRRWRSSAGTHQSQSALLALIALDLSLVTAENRPTPADFETALTAALALDGQTLSDAGWFDGWCGPTWARLLDTLIAQLLVKAESRTIARLTRLLLVAGLMRERANRGNAFDSAEQVFDLLRHRVPSIPREIFPDLMPSKFVTLVRDATVSDLYVVRSEWRCFVAGEVADIRNVMAKEHLNAKIVQIDQHEVMTDTTQQTTTTQTQENQSSIKSDVSEQTQQQMALALQANGQVSVSAQYGTAKIDATAGVSASFSLQDSKSRASQLSREVVARAASTVENTVRTERRDTTLTRFKQVYKHGFTNDSTTNLTGIYRWVDRIDRYQVFRYPNRLQLEFQLPEPGKYLRQRLASANIPTSVQKPPAFTLVASDIKPDSYATAVALYRASGVPAPPSTVLAVSSIISAPDAPPSEPGGARFDLPTIGDKGELALPVGYIVTHIDVSGTAEPLPGTWHREDEAHPTYDNIDAFHSIHVAVSIGDSTFTAQSVGTDVTNRNTIQGTGSKNSLVQYIDAICNFKFSVDKTDLTSPLPPLSQKVPFAIRAAGASSVCANVEATCVPSEETMGSWRQAMFDACLESWQQWNNDWLVEQQKLGINNVAFAERSPTRNAEMIMDEIKRQVIAWLLGEEPFKGRPALLANSIDTDIPAALKAAPDIQFLEQAFEWINVNYVPYAYYWAGRRTPTPDATEPGLAGGHGSVVGKDQAWNDLITIETADPNLGRFLRAGSARVVLPARPGFEEAVVYWLLYGKPWQGGPPPIPGDPDYLSVATEIHDLMVPPADGEPGDSWEVRLPTTLQWLDTSSALPHNQAGLLGKAPHEPPNVLCPDA